MHLKTEKINLVMLTFSPLLLAIVLFFFTFGETLHSDTHHIQNVSPTFKLPAAEHAAGEAKEH